jgi:hypothetical protein
MVQELVRSRLAVEQIASPSGVLTCPDSPSAIVARQHEVVILLKR